MSLLSSIFSGPELPPAPPPPPSRGGDDDLSKEIQANAARQRRLAALSQGRKSTILGGSVAQPAQRNKAKLGQ